MISPKLRTFANRQGGYFTTHQAELSGYSDQSILYHSRHGDWLRISRGLFRLPGYADDQTSEFARWTLWAKGSARGRQATVSHSSALYFYGLTTVPPAVVTLTVSDFRLRPPVAGCVLVHETLTPLDRVRQDGFCVTTPERTLADLRPDLEFSGLWLPTLRAAMGAGTLTKLQAQALNDGCAVAVEGAVDSAGRWVPASAPWLAEPKKEILPMRFASGDRSAAGLRRVPNRSFTLVEMLVVLAIISILAMLLLPTLNSSLAAARELSCLTSLRQLGVGWSGYTQDNGAFPVSDDSYLRYWLALGSYMSAQTGSSSSLPYYKCPQEADRNHYSYAANYYIPNSRSSSGVEKVRTAGLRPSLVSNTSQKILMGDSLSVWCVFRAGNAVTPESGGVSFRHQERAAFLFFDLHAATREEYWSYSDPSVNWYLP